MEHSELFRERLARIEDKINCKTPDRVPVTSLVILFHAHYSGYTAKDIFFDYEKNRQAAVKVGKDFDFDSLGVVTGLEASFMSFYLMKNAPELVPSARFHKLLGDVFTKWPGIELEDDLHPQFIGSEIMKVDEYDKFIADPLGFVCNEAVPRICKGLANPGSVEAGATLTKYGAELEKYGNAVTDLIMSLAQECSLPSIPMIAMHRLIS
ncbi:hypothetical protein J2128_002182 [Methanomicrobium sp. W14]|uniref:hypothetical protein n=1 Tax=Methanomicrobium sp. W14 TaxID=2817839 RepID=UPI001FD87FA3|nr:hypothetical protein [Methanomicrobium sp. W14]MBP2134216.1 hypothetical protein [Methanomicrobium sp. W14]